MQSGKCGNDGSRVTAAPRARHVLRVSPPGACSLSSCFDALVYGHAQGTRRTITHHEPVKTAFHNICMSELSEDDGHGLLLWTPSWRFCFQQSTSISHLEGQRTPIALTGDQNLSTLLFGWLLATRGIASIVSTPFPTASRSDGSNLGNGTTNTPHLGFNFAEGTRR